MRMSLVYPGIALLAAVAGAQVPFANPPQVTYSSTSVTLATGGCVDSYRISVDATVPVGCSPLGMVAIFFWKRVAGGARQNVWNTPWYSTPQTFNGGVLLPHAEPGSVELGWELRGLNTGGSPPVLNCSSGSLTTVAVPTLSPSYWPPRTDTFIVASPTTGHANPQHIGWVVAAAGVQGSNALTIDVDLDRPVSAGFPTVGHEYDGCYDFRWVHVITSWSEAGTPGPVPVPQPSGPPISTPVPLVDPQPGQAVGSLTPAVGDGLPFYWNERVWHRDRGKHVEGDFTWFVDAPSGSGFPADTVVSYETFLVAVSRASGAQQPGELCVLMGCRWRYFSCLNHVQWLGTIPGDWSQLRGAIQNWPLQGTQGWVVSDCVLESGCAPLRLPGASQVSLSTGGSVQIDIDAGAALAGETWWMVGSLTGSMPGIVSGVYTLPVVADPYTAWTLTTGPAVGAPLASGVGTLDGAGRASTTFALPPGLGALAGLSAFHAFFVPRGNAVTFVSNPVEIRLVP